MSALPASPDSETHTYPPTPSAAVAPPVVANEEDPSSECLLCLSSAREVVLLPCRHLVACKDCALNMVEFGAGGNIIQPEEPAAADTETAADGAGTAATGAPISPVSPTNTRRKRKAKGWFCPVCRQRKFPCVNKSIKFDAKSVLLHSLHFASKDYDKPATADARWRQRSPRGY